MKKFWLALSLIVITASCSKNSSTTTSVNTILMTGKWKLSSAKITFKNPSGLDTTLDMIGGSYIPSCKQGIYLVFGEGENGAMYNPGSPCLPSDPTEINFQWDLVNNNTGLKIYNGFNMIYDITDTVQPLYFDTIVNNTSATPPLVLDSIVTYEDTSIGGNPNYVVLDSMWNLLFYSFPDPESNIYGQLSNVSQNAFTLNFYEITLYPDTTKNHGNDPIYRPDTAYYTLGFSNF